MFCKIKDNSHGGGGPTGGAGGSLVVREPQVEKLSPTLFGLQTGVLQIISQ